MVIISKIKEILQSVKADIIYVPNRSDVRSDHRIAFKSAYSCTKSFRYPFVKRILMYETLSETEFAPSLPENVFLQNVFVDISDYFEKN